MLLTTDYIFAVIYKSKSKKFCSYLMHAVMRIWYYKQNKTNSTESLFKTCINKPALHLTFNLNFVLSKMHTEARGDVQRIIL